MSINFSRGKHMQPGPTTINGHEAIIILHYHLYNFSQSLLLLTAFLLLMHKKINWYSLGILSLLTVVLVSNTTLSLIAVLVQPSQIR